MPNLNLSQYVKIKPPNRNGSEIAWIGLLSIDMSLTNVLYHLFMVSLGKCFIFLTQ